MIGDFVRSLHVRPPSRVDTTSAGAHEQGRGPAASRDTATPSVAGSD